MSDPFRVSGPALISFSGGRTSGYMLKRILDAYGGKLPPDIRVAFCNTGKEHEATLEFVRDCSERWRVDIAWLQYDKGAANKLGRVDFKSAARAGEPFADIINSKNYLPSPRMRFCTISLKIKLLQAYASLVCGWESWGSVVGIRADEPRRVRKQVEQGQLRKASEGVPIMPLHEAGVVRSDVAAWWREQPFGLGLPITEDGRTLGGNCVGCHCRGTKEMLETAARGLLTREDLAWWVAQEEQIELRNGKGFYKFRTDRTYAQIWDKAFGGSTDDVAGEDLGPCTCSG